MLPDFSSKPLSSSVETSAEKEIYARKLNKWLAVAWQEHSQQQQVPDDKAVRRPNQHWLLALEHGLQAGTGLSFKDFLPPKLERARAKVSCQSQWTGRSKDVPSTTSTPRKQSWSFQLIGPQTASLRLSFALTTGRWDGQPCSFLSSTADYWVSMRTIRGTAAGMICVPAWCRHLFGLLFAR